jgi:primosomal protein N' (replication factor Y) (superfamily II helicase)
MSTSPTEFAVHVVTGGVPGVLSYALGEEFLDVDIGHEVLIELGHRETKGWVVARVSFEEALQDIAAQQKNKHSTRIENKLPGTQLAFFPEAAIGQKCKELKPVKSAVRVFLPEQLQLFQWISEYYGAALSEVIENAIPQRVSPRKVLCVKPSPLLYDYLSTNTDFLSTLKHRAPLQASIVEMLTAENNFIPIAQLEGLSSSVRSALKALEQKELVQTTQVDASELSAYREKAQPAGPLLYSGVVPELLTDAQNKATHAMSKALREKTFNPFLLFGVTGSGKTEVYIRAIEEASRNGGSALVVVPEIALTPQFVDQFQARLNVPVALLHSQVGASARWEAWDALLKGKIHVALGARSAVFAPLNDLSLIVIDEEHESSYKQSDGLRYNARDVAVMRAKFAGATIVLGSATPSFESLLNAQTRRYKILELPERATTRPLPQLEIIDLTKIKRKEMPSENISPQLYEAIKETLEAKGQVIILYNRRGFASYLQCESCNEVVTCPNCSVPLTSHRKGSRLLCHYCGLSMNPPTYCSFCRNPHTSRVELAENGKPLEKKSVIEAVGRLISRGGGTERVVDELADLFPLAAIIRMDRDAVEEKGAYRRILGSMRNGTADILVGTQMIAKGHDLPGVTLVGVISADVGLHIPDFRSSEKAFQLITQAGGRCGRGKDPGRVFVQTREPNHPTIVATVTGRFKAFARYELEFRKGLGYPPYGRLLRLVISSTDRQEACDCTQRVRTVLGELVQAIEKSSATILGPAPAPHEKLRGRYRWHILLKSNSAKVVSQIAAALYDWRGTVKDYKDFRLAIDVDPVDML